ncbi:hypothetical protein L0P72_05530 [[Ruminococcus] torques]|nr:hypothetical protein [[Ruminococcus] torques]
MSENLEAACNPRMRLLALWVSGTEGEEKRRCEGKFSLISSAFHSSIVERSWDAMSRTIEKMGRGVDNE